MKNACSLLCLVWAVLFSIPGWSHSGGLLNRLDPGAGGWLAETELRRGQEAGWMPFSFADHRGRIIGIGVDYWHLIRAKLGLRERLAPPLPFDDLLQGMQDGDIDLYPVTTRTAEREAYAVFTEPYADFPVGIAAPASAGFVFDPATLEGKTVAVGRNYSAYHLLRDRHPGIRFLQVRDTPAALRQVAAGHAVAAVDILPVLQYQIDLFDYLDLRVAGVTDVHFPLQVMVHRDHARLVPLLNRAIAAITPEERMVIHRQWMLRDIVPTTDYTLLWQVLGGGVVLVGLVLYWNRRLAASRAALQQSQARYQRLVDDIGPDFVIYSLGHDGRVEYVSRGSETIFGIAPGAALGRSFAQVVAWKPGVAEDALARLRRMLSSGEPAERWEMSFDRADGTTGTVLVTPHPARNEHGVYEHVEGIVEDVTERRESERRLKLAAQVFTHAREGIFITDADARIVDVNEAFCRITGYGPEEVIGRNPRILKSGLHDAAFYAAMWRSLEEDGHWSGEIWNRNKRGEIFAELLTISRVVDHAGGIQQYVALFSDITGSKKRQQQLEYMARYDALTGLPNRGLLADRLGQAMAQAHRRGQRLAVVFLDLDGFKQINDAHGHHVGDRLLVALANRFSETLREGDTVARIGGDEFVAILPDLSTAEGVEPLLQRLLAAAARPVAIDALSLQCSASMGVAFFPQPAPVSADQLVRQADQAMFQAKQSGRGRFHHFDAGGEPPWPGADTRLLESSREE